MARADGIAVGKAEIVDIGEEIAVLAAEFGSSVSKNPYLAFKFKGGAKGEKVIVSWKDNKGDSRTDEATIS